MDVVGAARRLWEVEGGLSLPGTAILILHTLTVHSLAARRLQRAVRLPAHSRRPSYPRMSRTGRWISTRMYGTNWKSRSRRGNAAIHSGYEVHASVVHREPSQVRIRGITKCTRRQPAGGERCPRSTDTRDRHGFRARCLLDWCPGKVIQAGHPPPAHQSTHQSREAQVHVRS